MSRHHTAWTPSSISAWSTARDERRKSKGHPPLHALGPADKAAALETERRELIEGALGIVSAQAWDIGKHPLAVCPAPFAGVVLLPRNYHARDGVHKIRVRKGDDLNNIVYRHYDEVVDAKTYPGDNYVSKDGIRARRHEYLGPSPRLASYRFTETETEIEIEWWEEYIEDRWIGARKWKVEAAFDEAVQGWFLVDRNG